LPSISPSGETACRSFTKSASFSLATDMTVVLSDAR
jgi:hypothetical protein